MSGRLGNVLYWVGCIGAAFFIAVAAFTFFNITAGRPISVEDRLGISSIFLIPALVSWLIGRVCRYILSGS